MESLERRFAEACLPLELRVVPLFEGRDERIREIVQIDITREPRVRRPPERFRVFRGHDDNQLEVLAVDERLRQLVLFVDEPERAYEAQLSRFTAVPRDATVVRREKGGVVIEQRTFGRARHFLCGMDEAHLFIALLPGPAASVRAAHDALRDPLVDLLEERAPSATIRQGEWFFVALEAGEEGEVDHFARKVLRVTWRSGIAEAAGIRRIGRPHIADEVLVARGLPGMARDEGARVYVRGAVRHPDHATLVLDRWRRVVPNLEALEAPIEGIDWID